MRPGRENTGRRGGRLPGENRPAEEGHVRRNTSRVMTGGAPVNWLGANFWSRTGGPLMWRRYDPAVIAAELAVLRRHGLTMTRSFFYWPDFMPGPREIDETMTAC